MRKRTFGHVRPAKIQIRLHIQTGRILDSLGCKVSSCGQRRLSSDCADAQTDLSLLWAHLSEGTFSPIAAHIAMDTTEKLCSHFAKRGNVCGQEVPSSI